MHKENLQHFNDSSIKLLLKLHLTAQTESHLNTRIHKGDSLQFLSVNIKFSINPKN